MSEKSLVFDTGAVTYHIGNAIDISFNPTDSFFVERLFVNFDELGKKQEAYEKAVEKMADRRKIFDFMRERDAEMRKIIDETLGAPVCDAVFGRMNVYALASGLPVWANLILAIIEEVDTAFAREQKVTNPRLQKYLTKYRKNK